MAGSLAQVQGGSEGAATPAVDPAAYMQAMQGMMSNPQFMQMAERLGTQMMQVRALFWRRSGACWARIGPTLTRRRRSARRTRPSPACCRR